MDEGTLRIHQVKFMIDARENLSNCRGVADHATSTHDLGQVTSRNHGWWLVIDAAFESSWRPINKLDCAFGLDGGNGSVHILGNHITTIHHAACHILAMARIALDEHRSRF